MSTVWPSQGQWQQQKPGLGLRPRDGYWPVAPYRWLFNEGAGATVADIGSGNNGTLNSGCSWGAGPQGSWLVTDGVTGIVSAPIANGPQLNGSWSLICWLKVLGAAASNRKVWSVLAGANTTTMTSAGVLQGDAGASLVSSSLTLTDKIHQTVYTFDGTTNRVYFDGLLNASSTTAPSTGTVNKVIFGARNSGDQLTNTGVVSALFVPFMFSAQQIANNFADPYADIECPAWYGFTALAAGLSGILCGGFGGGNFPVAA